MVLGKHLQNLNFNWERILLEIDPQEVPVFKFSITPQEFLEFAREDIKNVETRGIVNAISNVKRSIDCQIDTVRTFLGYDPFANKQPAHVLSYIDDYENRHSKINAAMKQKLFQSIGAAPHGVLSRVRTLRNKLEYGYKLPSHDDVQEGIEIASMFIKAIKYYLSRFDCAPIVTCNDERDPTISIGYCYQEYTFKATAMDQYFNKYFEDIFVDKDNEMYVVDP